MNQVQWQCEPVEDCLVATPQGTLDPLSYRDFRDTMIKFAVDQPRVVIVAIDRLELPAPSALTAFSSAAMQVSDWPGVPIVIVAGRADHRAVLDRTKVSRFVAVFPDVAAAVAAARQPPRCRRAILDLGDGLFGARRARLFVRTVCQRWQVGDLLADAEQIATELVENALLHTASAPQLRLELRGGLLTVAVSDDSADEAVLREPDRTANRGVGLRIVADRAKAWGCTPSLNGGKVVWAVLRTAGPLEQLRRGR